MAFLAPFLNSALTIAEAVAVSSLATAVVAMGLRSAGWLGGQNRLTDVSWLPDGSWLLADDRHSSIPARLTAGSRIGQQWLWLRWTEESSRRGRRSLLLVRGDLPSCEMRRLGARLRLETPTLCSEPPRA